MGFVGRIVGVCWGLLVSVKAFWDLLGLLAKFFQQISLATNKIIGLGKMALLEMEGRCWPGGAAWGRECRRRSRVLPLNLSDTAATIQDGSSLKYIAAIEGRQCYI